MHEEWIKRNLKRSNDLHSHFESYQIKGRTHVKFSRDFLKYVQRNTLSLNFLIAIHPRSLSEYFFTIFIRIRRRRKKIKQINENEKYFKRIFFLFSMPFFIFKRRRKETSRFLWNSLSSRRTCCVFFLFLFLTIKVWFSMEIRKKNSASLFEVIILNYYNAYINRELSIFLWNLKRIGSQLEYGQIGKLVSVLSFSIFSHETFSSVYL